MILAGQKVNSEDRNMRKQIRKLLLLMIVTVLLFGILAVPAGAAVRKLRYQPFTRVRAKADAKALSVREGLTTVKIPKKGRGYLKYTAAKDGTYAFTLSGLKSKKQKVACTTKKGKVKTKKIRPFSNGYFYVMTADAGNALRIGQAPLETSGGTTNALWVATREVQFGNQVGWRLKKRIGKIALEAGQTVYLYFNFNKGDTVKLRIERAV